MKLGVPMAGPSLYRRPDFRDYADEITFHKSTIEECFACVAEALAEAKHTEDCIAMVLAMTAPTVHA